MKQVSPTTALSLKNITLAFSDSIIFNDLSLDVTAEKWTCLLGQSGCGKSTLLRLIAGLQQPDSGSVDYTATSSKRHISYMAQDDCLMPWLTIQDNIMLGARLRKEQSTKSLERALELLYVVGLSDYAASMPATLSGGQRQRAALARTLFEDCPIVLMDEPFSKLDAISRYKLQNLAATVLEDRTVIMVTHDPQEALRLSHSILVLSHSTNSITELANLDSPTPRELDQPAIASYQQKLWQHLK